MKPSQNIPPLKFKQPLVIAGPCSAETEEQTLATARSLATAGIGVFRAGLWKPRTSPTSFEGVGAQGLEWLKKVKQTTGMLVATEVATANHVQLALDAHIDILWIGARTTTNPFAVQEIADAIKDSGVTVLVKNPVSPDIDLWTGALERILNAGITNLGAIHRGFSTADNDRYRNAPLWHIPIELKRRIPGITLLCDPSHIGGNRNLIQPLARQACDIGFDGLFVEAHINPDSALSDSQQQITPQRLDEILQSLTFRKSGQVTPQLELLREQIDLCDDELIAILNRRMQLSQQIGKYKRKNNLQVVNTHRYNSILQKMIECGQAHGMSPQFIKVLMQAIHEESVRQQIEHE